MAFDEKDFQKIIEKLKDQKGPDLSAAEDLSIGVMNLISLEEHFFFSGVKTGNDEYFDLSKEARTIRTHLMEKLLDKEKYEGETWCATKHILSATMRLIETGNRFMADGKKGEAKEMYQKAYTLYSIFWGLRLKLIDVKQISADKNDSSNKWSIEDLTTKLSNCCNE